MRYAHTNIGARDVERLAKFYEQVFGCTRTSPTEKMSGALIARGEGLQEAEMKGVWMRLPGYGDQGPILELFEYTKSLDRPEPLADRQGYNHIAFEVSDVEATAEAVLAAGGTRLGEIVDLDMSNGGVVTFVFLRDPEDNIIEVMHFSN